MKVQSLVDTYFSGTDRDGKVLRSRQVGINFTACTKSHDPGWVDIPTIKLFILFIDCLNNYINIFNDLRGFQPRGIIDYDEIMFDNAQLSAYGNLLRYYEVILQHFRFMNENAS